MLLQNQILGSEVNNKGLLLSFLFCCNTIHAESVSTNNIFLQDTEANTTASEGYIHAQKGVLVVSSYVNLSTGAILAISGICWLGHQYDLFTQTTAINDPFFYMSYALGVQAFTSVVNILTNQLWFRDGLRSASKFFGKIWAAGFERA